MKTTTAFNYSTARQYAIDLFNTPTEAYEQDKKAEALLILLGLDSGFRVTDLLNLKFSDIELSQTGKPYIESLIRKKSKRDKETGQYIKKSFLTLPISSTTHRLIEVYYNYCQLHNGYVNDLIFYNYKTEKPYSRQWTSKRLKIANENGELGRKVKTAGAHSLRKAAGANAYDKCGNLRAVQVMLGHSRLSQTEKYLDIDKERAMEILERVHD